MFLTLLKSSGAGPASQTLTPSLYTDADSFFAATVAAGTVTLTQGTTFTDGDTFFSSTIAQVTLTPALYTDADTFYAATLTSSNTLTPALYTDADSFFAATTSSVYAIPRDPYDSSVVALLRMDGNATDLKGHTFTTGGVTFNGTVSKFDQNAQFLGQAATYGVYTNSNDFIPGTSEFTVEFWTYIPAFSGDMGLFQIASSINPLNGGIGLALYGSGISTSYLFFIRDGNYVSATSAILNTNTWHHIALVRRASSIFVYVDGVQKYTEGNGTNYSATDWLRIGGYYNGNYTMTGRIDDFRYTKAARYSSNFSVPTTPHGELPRFDNSNTFYAATVTLSGVTLSPNRYDNAQTFYAATVTPGAVNLTPSLYTDADTYNSHVLNQPGGSQNVVPNLFTNSSTFYATAVSATYALTPARYDNSSTFYTATLTQDQTLTASRYNNATVFYGPTVQTGTGALYPNLFSNSNAFYAATVTPGAVALTAARYNNAQTFYGTTVVAQYSLTPSVYNNANNIYAPTVAAGAVSLLPPFVASTTTFYDPIVGSVRFVAPPLVTDGDTFHAPTAQPTNALQPTLHTNVSAFYSALVSMNVTLSASRFNNTNTFYFHATGDVTVSFKSIFVRIAADSIQLAPESTAHPPVYVDSYVPPIIVRSEASEIRVQ